MTKRELTAKVQVNRRLFGVACDFRHDQSEHSYGNHAGDQAARWKSGETSHVQDIHRESQWNPHEVHSRTLLLTVELKEKIRTDPPSWLKSSRIRSILSRSIFLDSAI